MTLWAMLTEPLARLSTPDVAILVAATLLAGVVRGFSGFGSAMILVPSYSLVFGPAAAIPMMSLVDVTGSLGLMPRALRRCTWREVAPLTLGASLLLPLGVYLLIVVDQELLRWVISVTIILVVVVLASGWRYQAKPTPLLSVGIGGAAGLMGGSIGIAGPPVILFWLGGRSTAETVRANTIVFLALLVVAAWISFFVGGLFTREVLVVAALLAPLYAVAIWLGARSFRFADEQWFRRLALGIIAVIALVSLLG
ncbi:sulfite exporter TauE/SafE family protein [Algihabitans albus]|uniref:sulfite exporter TauE/SafE family protein n=1 Tax=Algihabitans albus TaxID=2164067 RepID=UPI0035D07BF0